MAHIDNPNDPNQPLYTQTIIITASNPQSGRTASIILKAIDKFELSTLAIALIVIGSIVLLIVVIVVGRIAVRKLKKRLKLVPLIENAEM